MKANLKMTFVSNYIAQLLMIVHFVNSLCLVMIVHCNRVVEELNIAYFFKVEIFVLYPLIYTGDQVLPDGLSGPSFFSCTVQ